MIETHKTKSTRGRPRKIIDPGVVFHMIKNCAPITAVANHLGVHRDTLYANFPVLIKEAYASHREAWGKISDEMFANWLEQKRLIEELQQPKRKKRKYLRKQYHRR